jgi:hypothetical protein
MNHFHQSPIPTKIIPPSGSLAEFSKWCFFEERFPHQNAACIRCFPYPTWMPARSNLLNFSNLTVPSYFLVI